METTSNIYWFLQLKYMSYWWFILLIVIPSVADVQLSPSCWIAIVSLFLIISDFILKKNMDACFRLFKLTRPTRREEGLFKNDFLFWFDYISAYVQYIILSLISSQSCALLTLFFNLFKIHIEFYKELYKKTKSIKMVLNSYHPNILGCQGYDIFFEYKRSFWHWYHYIFLIGCILSWISSFVLGFKSNLDPCSISVFLTFIFLTAFHYW